MNYTTTPEVITSTEGNAPTDEQRAAAKAKAAAFIKSLTSPGGALDVLIDLVGALVAGKEGEYQIARMQVGGEEVDAIVSGFGPNAKGPETSVQILAILPSPSLMKVTAQLPGTGSSPDTPQLAAQVPPYSYLLGVAVAKAERGGAMGCGNPECETCSKPAEGAQVH